ncbi:MAG: 6-bladed beta-propeller [Niabella sp.]
MRILVSTFTCLLCLLAAAQDKNLYLNPDNAAGAKASVLFESADLIQLQTTKENSFNNIADFLVTPDHYIFLDDAGKNIFVFAKDGQFLFKYQKKKYKIESLQYVYSKNALFIVSRNKNYTIPQAKSQQMITRKAAQKDFSRYVKLELLYLDRQNRQQVESLPVPAYALNTIYYFNNGYLVENNRYDKYLKDSVAYHLLLLQNNKVIQSYFPFINLPKLPSYYQDIDFSVRNLNDTTFLVQKGFDNTIYRLTPDSVYAEYKFVFPAAQTMPGDFQSTLFKDNIEFTNYKNKNSNAIAGFENLLQHKNFLFFSASDNAHKNKKYLFNSLNNNLYDLGKVTTDSSIYFLPSRLLSSVSEQDSGFVYTWMSNNDLIREKPNLLSKKQQLPGHIRALLDGLNKFNNPIIIKFKTKTQAN